MSEAGCGDVKECDLRLGVKVHVLRFMEACIKHRRHLLAALPPRSILRQRPTITGQKASIEGIYWRSWYPKP